MEGPGWGRAGPGTEEPGRSPLTADHGPAQLPDALLAGFSPLKVTPQAGQQMGMPAPPLPHSEKQLASADGQGLREGREPRTGTPGIPVTPGTPCTPWKPTGPGEPGTPSTPLVPLGPWMPFGPSSPRLPGWRESRMRPVTGRPPGGSPAHTPPPSRGAGVRRPTGPRRQPGGGEAHGLLWVFQPSPLLWVLQGHGDPAKEKCILILLRGWVVLASKEIT